MPSRVSDHAFDLSFANGPYIERVRDYQRILKGTGTYDAVICFNLQVGPFMDRARKRNNVAVPFIRDFNLRMLWQRAQSEFDVNYQDTMNPENQLFPDRTICNGLLEFGTPVNLRHAGEADLPSDGWASGGFSIKITRKPYLQVDYVKMGGLEPSYRLRALEYRYEKSNQFQFTVPELGAKLESNKVLTRINTRLNSFPSKCYIFAELADGYKNPYFMGGTYRFCKLTEIKLRINQRTDVVNSPEESECYEQFKLLTNNSLEKPAWAKSPVYVFSSDFFGQPDMLSGDGVLNTFEWEAEVELSELQCEELAILNRITPYKSMGYDAPFNFINTLPVPNTGLEYGPFRFYYDWLPNPGAAHGQGEPLNLLYAHKWIDPRDSYMNFQMTELRTQSFQRRMKYSNINSLKPGFFNDLFSGSIIQQMPLNGNNFDIQQSSEYFKVNRTTSIQYRLDGLWWGCCDTYNPVPGGSTNFPLVKIGDFFLWWVPESYIFSFDESDVFQNGDDTQSKAVMNSFSKLTWNHPPPATTNVMCNSPAFLTGYITQKNWRVQGHQMAQTVGFNRNITAATVPGPRAYPATPTGVYMVGWNDQGAAPNVWGGLPAQNAGGVTNAEIGWKYMNATIAGNPGYKWCAFQGPPSVHSNLPANDPYEAYGRLRVPPVAKPNTNNGTVLPDGQNMRSGLTQTRQVLGNAAGGNRVPHSGKTQTIVQCDVTRHTFGNVEHERYNVSDQVVPLMQNYGYQLLVTDTVIEDRVSTLKYELKCLYEFGEQEYKFSKDGGKPEKINNIVVNAAQSFNDPRLKQDAAAYSAEVPVADTGLTYS